ncbi:MAG: DNA mismatch repair endonuclease MutL, partial [Algisphaera sp.]
MPIRALDPHLVNQIAAGEVIERPASVVKELLENCVDAGATRIDIAVEEGGAKLIRISDDGCGISEDELPLALTAHATSKLQTAEQLAAIDTLGFRGEALASIASVSRMVLKSRLHNAESGAMVEQQGDQRGVAKPVAMAPGTVIEVRDLFFNVPARRKFLRIPGTEYGQIADTVNRSAMANPEVGYTLTHNGRKTIDLPAKQKRRERCVAILGKDLDEALLEFAWEDTKPSEPELEPTRVWGVAGEPSIARATAKFMHVYINGRPVKDRSLNHAVKEAYRGLMAHDRSPVAAVFIQMDPSMVDVNVHPTKAEVRFREPRRMHRMVMSPIRERLLSEDLTPVAGVGSAGSLGSGGAGPSAWRGGEVRSPAAGPGDFVTAFERMPATQKGFVYDEVRRAMAADNLFVAETTGVAEPGGASALVADAEVRAAGIHAGEISPGVQRVAQGVSPTLPTVMQVHDSYVIAQDATGVLIIDQHALHERVMFEAISHRILTDRANLESQRLLMPAVVDADAARVALLDDAAPLFERLGIEVSPLGPAAIGIHAFPSLLLSRGVKPEPFVEGVLGKIEEGVLSGEADALETEAALHVVLDMMSCKAAVKAGDKLTQVELAALLKTRDEVERAGSCPHGRPTTVRLTLRD